MKLRLRAGVAETAQQWAKKLYSEAESRTGDCVHEGMSESQARDSIHDMLLEFVRDRRVPQNLQGRVADLLLRRLF